jgi:hypothetical protein
MQITPQPFVLARARSVAAILIAAGAVGNVGGLSGLAGVGLLALAASPQCALAQCGDLELSQSTDPDTIQPARAVWCGSLVLNDGTQIGRGFTAPHDLTISCVTFGVTANTGADWPCHVRILGGPITAPYDTRPVLGETTVMVPAGTSSAFFTAQLPAVFIPAGASFIVELDTPTRVPAAGGDGALLSLGFNGLGQSAPTYLRAPGCGANNFIDTAALGFPNSHAAITVGAAEGYTVPTLGGFPVGVIGPAMLGVLDGEAVAYGDGSATPFGLSIDFGDLTMGVGATCGAISTGDETDPTLSIGFKNGTSLHDRIVFRNNPATPDEAVLELDFTTAAFDRFNVHVLLDGELVGTLEDQTSGSVRFIKPDDGPIWDWIKGLFTGPKKMGCSIHKEYYPASEGGGLKSETMFYGIEIGAARVAPTGGGLPGFLGDEIWIEPVTATVGGSPPLRMELTATGIVGLTVDVSDSAPTVVFGVAETGVRPFGGGTTTQVGVSARTTTKKANESSPQLISAQMIGDGAPDLRVLPSLDPGAENGFLMELGGVVSATVGLDVLTPDPAAACMTVCSFEVGTVGIPTGKTSFDPWPINPALTAVAPDFTGVGDETYTLQVYDAAGTLVHEASGQSGIAGGTTRWPSKVGKLGGRTPCFRICYPRDTILRLADGRQFEVLEVRALAEGAPEAGPLHSLEFTVQNMNEMVLFDPETVLPEIAEPCYADLDGDGALTIFDFLAFQNAFASGDPVADCDGDGALTLFDFLCFQNSFAAGCP